MKMTKKYKRICVACALGATLCATTVNAANYTKSLKALYKNIGVTYNGTQKTLSSEPFVVDNVTYVPLRGVSEVMGANVNWNGATNTVEITNTTADSTSLQQQLSNANYQVATLQRELQQVKAELETYKNSSSSNTPSSGTAVTTGTDITTAELKATEDYLNKTYSTELHEDIILDFELTKKSSRLELVISYSDRDEEKTYNDLSQRKIEGFLEDVCDDISSRHAEINIRGVVNYTRNDIDKAEFDYTYKNNRLSTDHGLDEDDIIEIVEDTYSKLSIPSFGATSIKSVDATVNDSSTTVTFTIYIDSKTIANSKDTWNEAVDADSTSTLRKEFKAIAEAIQEETSYDVNGELYLDNTSTLLAEYDGNNNKLSLKKMK